MFGNRLRWVENMPSKEWDTLLAHLNGHPLQSALWGDARLAVEGVVSWRWAVFKDGELLGLVRFELRGPKFVKKVVWVPQGPVGDCWPDIVEGFYKRLKQHGLILCIMWPWEKVELSQAMRKTIWIDLTVGKEKLWENVDSRCRYSVRRAEKLGIEMAVTSCVEDVAAFYQLCQVVSESKSFELRGSLKFFLFLLQQGSLKTVGAQLWIARYQGKLCAGALLLQSGKNLHYMWGGVDRHYSKERLGEGLQWAIIDWACAQGFLRYDLEGIDEINNPGVTAFKKKLGGVVVGLASKNVYPLNWQGRVLMQLGRKYLE